MLAPWGVMTRKSRIPGTASASHVTRSPVFDAMTSFLAASSGFSDSGFTISARTPRPETTTALAPARL